MAAVGSDHVLIGALGDHTGAPNAGSAYLFDLPYPPLNIVRSGGAVSLSWLTAETGMTLQQSDQLGMAALWSNTPESVAINGLNHGVQQPLTSGIPRRFFHLRRQ